MNGLTQFASDARLHIGVDATCWYNLRGYGRHARALLSAVVALDRRNRYTFFVDKVGGEQPLPDGVEVRAVHASEPTALAASAAGHRSPADMWRMSRALSQAAVDVLLFPTIYSYVPVLSRAKKIVFMHDVIAERFPELTIPNRKARLLWKTKVTLGRIQADAVVTVSEYSRRCIVEHFGIPPDSVFVVGEASDSAFRELPDAAPSPRLAKAGITGQHRYVVYVGGFGPHKNLSRLISAFARISANADNGRVRLVLVGEYKNEVFHSSFAELTDQVTQLGLDERVFFTGYLPDEDVALLHNIADVLVLPSLMEGFGLPAVEAAACGCPVIATTSSPLPELLGDAGIYVDPLDELALENALRRVLSSSALRTQMSGAGVRAASMLTWKSAALQLLGVLGAITPQSTQSE